MSVGYVFVLTSKNPVKMSNNFVISNTKSSQKWRQMDRHFWVDSRDAIASNYV